MDLFSLGEVALGVISGDVEVDADSYSRAYLSLWQSLDSSQLSFMATSGHLVWPRLSKANLIG